MIKTIFSRNFVANTLLVFFIFLFDRISKIYVIYLDKNFSGSEIFSSKFLNINLIWNEGIAFGLLSFNIDKLYTLITFLILLIISIIFYMVFYSEGLKKYSLLMVLGGALGNVYDRIFYGAVPDFIDFHISNFHWFVFNIADIFVTLGVICLIVAEIFFNKNKINA